MEKIIYLDNSATTRATPAVVSAVCRALEAEYANPSSLHAGGIAAEREFVRAREAIASVLGAPSEKIHFTSGGTEGANLAILGAAAKSGFRHAVTSRIEHSSVLHAYKALEERGVEVTYLPPDENGAASLSALEKALRPDTSLVSIIHVNNETGAISPVEKMKPIIEKHAPRALFHVDAVQSFGKMELLPEKWGIDLLTASAHKIHGPKGVGLIYVSKKNAIRPILYGGGQEGGLRPGTENIPGVMGFAAACGEIDPNASERVANLRAMLLDGVLENIKDVEVNSPVGCSPYILNISFIGIPGEVMLNALSAEGIYVSTGSACARGRDSHVLAAMKKRHLKSAIRFSFSQYTTEEEIEKTLKTLIRLSEELNPRKRRGAR